MELVGSPQKAGVRVVGSSGDKRARNRRKAREASRRQGQEMRDAVRAAQASLNRPDPDLALVPGPSRTPMPGLSDLPWTALWCWLPVPLVVAWLMDVSGKLGDGTLAGVVSVLLALPLLVWFTVSSWSSTTGATSDRVLGTVLAGIWWGLGAGGAFLAPTLVTVLVTEPGSAYVLAPILVAALFLVWPAVMAAVLAVFAFVVVPVYALLQVWRLRHGGLGTLRTRVGTAAIAMILLGIDLMFAGTSFGTGDQITARPRAVLLAVWQAWHATGHVFWLTAAGTVLFAAGLTSMSAALLWPRRSDERDMARAAGSAPVDTARAGSGDDAPAETEPRAVATSPALLVPRALRRWWNHRRAEPASDHPGDTGA